MLITGFCSNLLITICWWNFDQTNFRKIPSEPMQHRYVRLNITEAFSVIPGAPDLHVRQGSSLRLECQLMSATEPPIFVFWYRQGRMINYDAVPGLKVAATRNGSTLVIDKTQPSHGGNYTCQPSNAKSAYVMIHVIEGETNYICNIRETVICKVFFVKFSKQQSQKKKRLTYSNTIALQ